MNITAQDIADTIGADLHPHQHRMMDNLVITDQAQAQLDALRAMADEPQTKGARPRIKSAAEVALDITGDIIEPVSRVAPVGVPRSRRLARKQAQAEVRDMLKSFRRSRLERARADVAGLPEDLRNRSYAPEDLREARQVLPKDAGLLDVLTEAARIADLRNRLVILDEPEDADFGSVYDDLAGVTA